jgi:hypothetical protein
MSSGKPVSIGKTVKQASPAPGLKAFKKKQFDK